MRAAMGLSSEGYTHQLDIYYPERGGIQSLSDAVKDRVGPERLVPAFGIKKIKKEGKRWVVGDGKNERLYDRLVNTLHPLDFIGACADAPQEVREAVGRLRWNSIYLVMLGIGKPKISDIHWAYIPDSGLLPNRISFPSNLSPRNAPEGCSSVLAEITYCPDGSKAGMKDTEVVERAVEDLGRLGVIKRDDVIFRKLVRCEYAYVVYDTAYQENIRVLEDFAKREGITLLGRWGEFRYHNSDRCIERAMETAGLFS
jgi:protoporphyrinogen oxidase